jgi:hypothetical protein
MDLHWNGWVGRLASSRNRDGGRRYGTEVVIQADRRKLCSPSGKLYNTTPQHATLLNGPAKKNAWAHGNGYKNSGKEFWWIILQCQYLFVLFRGHPHHTTQGTSCKESAIRQCLLCRYLHLHMSLVREAHKLVRCNHRQCITKTTNYFFPNWPWYICQLFDPWEV